MAGGAAGGPIWDGEGLVQEHAGSDAIRSDEGCEQDEFAKCSNFQT